jgi:fumarate hydratase class II
MTAIRVEFDNVGRVKVPLDRLRDAPTQRSLEQWPIRLMFEHDLVLADRSRDAGGIQSQL